MTITVKQELCRGCGICMQVCPNDAIYLENRKAIIDQSKCSSCQLCINACPLGAIKIEEEIQLVSIEKPQVAEIVQSPATVIPSSSKFNWSKALLTFASQQVLPRLLDIVGSAIDQKVNHQTQERSYEGDNSVGGTRNGWRRQRRRHSAGRHSKRM